MAISSLATAHDVILTRIAIIGDIHAEDRTLERVLAWIEDDGPFDALLCTGDIVTGPGNAGRCCQLLMENGVSTVRGNHDRWFFQPFYDVQLPDATPMEDLDDAQRAFLRHLPATRTYLTAIGPMLLCHGTGDNDMLAVRPGDGEAFLSANFVLNRIMSEGYYTVMAGGHTHQRMARTIDHMALINAGTLRPDHQPCFMTLDFAGRRAHFFDIDVSTGNIADAQTWGF